MNAFSQTNFLTLYGASGCIGCSGDPNHNYGLIFANGTSQTIINFVTLAASSYNWNQVQILPDIVGFKQAITTDYLSGALSFVAYEYLSQWTAPVYDLVQFPPVLQKAWSDIKGSHGSNGGLLSGNYANSGPLIIAQIEEYAAKFNIPLLNTIP